MDVVFKFSHTLAMQFIYKGCINIIMQEIS